MTSTAFANLARNQARALGLPGMPLVALEHPVGGTPMDSVMAKVDGALDEILAKLTAPLLHSAELEAVPATHGAWHEVDTADEWSDLQRDFIELGWGDGLPMVPPTLQRVAAMVGHSGWPADHVVGVVAPKMGVATIELIAANAVMAGCRPEHMPVLVTALEALVEPLFSLKNTQATTHPASPLLIVSGPLALALNIHSGSGLFGPGPWANGAIGRAIRLMLLNIGGGRPVDVDRATMGHPGKFSYCIAENEAASPWNFLRAERGFASEVTTVTVLGGEAPHNINDHESTTAGGLLTTIAGAMAQVGQNSVESAAELLLILSPEHAATIAADGFSKDDVKRTICEEAWIPMSRFSSAVVQRRLQRFLPKRYLNRPPDTRVAVVQRPEDVIVIVAGGAGKHSMYVPTLCTTRSVTRPILKPDGSPWLAGDFQ